MPQRSFQNERSKPENAETNSASSEADSNSAGAGSTGNLDQTREDLNTTSISDPTGFMGKNSEVAWIKRFEDLAQLASQRSSPGTSARPSNHSSSGLVFIQDKLELLLTIRSQPDLICKLSSCLSARFYQSRYLEDVLLLTKVFLMRVNLL